MNDLQVQLFIIASANLVCSLIGYLIMIPIASNYDLI